LLRTVHRLTTTASTQMENFLSSEKQLKKKEGEKRPTFVVQRHE